MLKMNFSHQNRIVQEYIEVLLFSMTNNKKKIQTNFQIS